MQNWIHNEFLNLDSLQTFKRNKGNMEGKTKESKQKNKKFKI